MATLQDIFDKMEGREWGWFGLPEGGREYEYYENVGRIYITADRNFDTVSADYSLADLLANASWCKAVWGEERIGNSVEGWCDKWQDGSVFAYQVLQQQGEQEAIDYIFTSMLDG